MAYDGAAAIPQLLCWRASAPRAAVTTHKKPTAAFRFTLQRKSPLSAEQQLVAHFKIAVMMGDLQPGEQLPSVRQIEKDLGIGRNVVWRAYSKLAESGVITIENRRRAVVNTNNHSKQAAELVSVFGWLADDVLDRLRALRVHPQSFARFLSLRLQELDWFPRHLVFVECNKLQARRWAQEVSGIWDLPVPGIEIRALRDLPEPDRRQFRTVLTPLYHHDEVKEIFSDPLTNVVPLRLKWQSERIREWRALPPGSRMIFVLKRFECLGYGDPFARELNSLCPNLRVEVLSFKNSAQVKSLLKTGRFAAAFLSGSVREAVDQEVLESPLVVRDALRIDERSLAEARIRAGVVL
ncbi:MAG TPA: GntR family transcriptional regulator [Candidatus Acidoferrales bacterium]|nr:GntR family transcriptional regulator [Candidatus Acidoferrales bacterium]